MRTVQITIARTRERERERDRERDRDRERQTDRQTESSTILKYIGGKQASSTDTAISDKSILSSSQIRFL